MSNGSEIFITNLLSHPTLIGSIIVIIVSTILLIFRGQKLNKHIRRFIYVLIVVAILIILFLVITAIGFGNKHPTGSPVPIS